MKKIRPKGVSFWLLAASILMTGCAAPSPAATQTVDPQILAGTVSAAQTQAVQTVVHQMTQNAALTPSYTNTPLPTFTPLPTETPAATNTPEPIVTATFTATQIPPTATIVYVPSNTPTLKPRTLDYQCSVISQKPPDESEMNEGSDFDLKVTLKNTGKKTWDPDVVDFEYMSGDEFQKRDDSVSLPEEISPGETVTLIVDMTTKSMSGVKSTVWGLYNGDEDFCDVSLTILVK